MLRLMKPFNLVLNISAIYIFETFKNVFLLTNETYLMLKHPDDGWVCYQTIKRKLF